LRPRPEAQESACPGDESLAGPTTGASSPGGITTLEVLRCLKRRISDAFHRQLVADAERAHLATEPEPAGTGPGGHCGATQEPGRSTCPHPAHRHFGAATSRTADSTLHLAPSPRKTSRRKTASATVDKKGSRKDAPRLAPVMPHRASTAVISWTTRVDNEHADKAAAVGGQSSQFPKSHLGPHPTPSASRRPPTARGDPREQ